MKATMTLGGVDYEIDRLPIGTLRAIDEAWSDAPTTTMSKKEKEVFFFDQCIEIIFQALVTKIPTTTKEQIMKIPSDMSEVFECRRVILRHSGLVIDVEKKVGEAVAEAS